jgi:hypothetical protein
VVLAVKVGRQRRPAVGFGLALVTFNVYSYFWDYKAHRELFDQFELGRDGRGDGGFWYFLSTALPVLRFPYYFAAVSNVQYVRGRLGLKEGISAGAFLGLTIPAVTVLLIGYFVGSFLLASSLGEDAAGNTVLADARLLAWGLVAILGGLAVYIVLEAIAYLHLQRDINGVWDAYDRRAAQLMAPARAAPPAAALAWLPVPPTPTVPPGPARAPAKPTPPRAPRPSPPARPGGAAASAPASKPRAAGATKAKPPARPAAPRTRKP